MFKNTFVCTSYEGFVSDEWTVGDGVRYGGVTSGILFNLYVNEVLTDLADLPLGCELSGKRVCIFCCAEDIASLAIYRKCIAFYVRYTCSQVTKFISQNQC